MSEWLTLHFMLWNFTPVPIPYLKIILYFPYNNTFFSNNHIWLPHAYTFHAAFSNQGLGFF